MKGGIRSRSGLALHDGVVAFHGLIDPDYRGVISVVLFNQSNTAFTVTRGMRVAHLVFSPFYRVEFDVQKKLDYTERGSDGFGSSGTL